MNLHVCNTSVVKARNNVGDNEANCSKNGTVAGSSEFSTSTSWSGSRLHCAYQHHIIGERLNSNLSPNFIHLLLSLLPYFPNILSIVKLHSRFCAYQLMKHWSLHTWNSSRRADLISTKWLPARCPSIPTTEFSFGAWKSIIKVFKFINH
jgi:hypothetical protein